MGVAFGAATALTRTPAPGDAALAPPSSAVYQLSGYPDPGPPDASSWWRDWSIDWLWLAVAAVAKGSPEGAWIAAATLPDGTRARRDGEHEDGEPRFVKVQEGEK